MIMILDRYGNPIQIEKEALSTELATFTTATGMNMEIMPDPDPVLTKSGEDAVVLNALAADDQVTMAMQLRKRKVTNKGNYDYSPGQPDKGVSPSSQAAKICSDLTHDLAGIKLKNIFNSVLASNFYGYSVIELYWGVEGNRLKLVGMEEKPREWFGFTEKGKLFFYENGSKKDVPFGKFLVARHEPDYRNPYGLRLLSRCLWPVAFKKAGIEWCMKFLERYGMAWQVAKAPANFDEADRQKLAASLASMVQDAVAVLPFGAEHQIVAADSKGGADAYLNFLNFWNSTISKVLSCQTQSSEITGSTGTYASSKTHYEVLGDVAAADEMLVCDAMNDLGFIYAAVNNSVEYPPVFSFIEAKDHLAQADLDSKRYSVGVRFTEAHFERLGLERDEFTLQAEPQINPQTGSKTKTSGTASFAAAGTTGAGKFTEEQQAIEDLVDKVSPDAFSAFAGNERKILSVIESQDSYEGAFEKLLDLYPDLTAETLQDAMERSVLNIDLYGRWTAAREVKK